MTREQAQARLEAAMARASAAGRAHGGAVPVGIFADVVGATVVNLVVVGDVPIETAVDAITSAVERARVELGGAVQ